MDDIEEKRYNNLKDDFIYYTDKYLIKKLSEKNDKMKYLPLINKYEINLSKSCNKNLFIYINSYGFYCKSIIIKIIEPIINDELYDSLVKEYKLCKIKNLYFIKLDLKQIIIYNELLTFNDYSKYCYKKDIKCIKFPSNMEIYNMITYDFTFLNKLIYKKNPPEQHDDLLSDELNSVMNKKNDRECLSDEFKNIINDESSEDKDDSEDYSSEDDNSEDDNSEDDSEDDSEDNDSEEDDSEDDYSEDDDSEDENKNKSNKKKVENIKKSEKKVENNEMRKFETYCVPIYWKPCKKLIKLIEDNSELYRGDLLHHYYDCSNCEIVNNNDKDLKNDKRDIYIGIIDDIESLDDETEESISNNNFLERILDMYSFCKKFTVYEDDDCNKGDAKRILGGINYINIIYNKADNIYKDCFFVIYK